MIFSIRFICSILNRPVGAAAVMLYDSDYGVACYARAENGEADANSRLWKHTRGGVFGRGPVPMSDEPLFGRYR